MTHTPFSHHLPDAINDRLLKTARLPEKRTQDLMMYSSIIFRAGLVPVNSVRELSRFESGHRSDIIYRLSEITLLLNWPRSPLEASGASFIASLSQTVGSLPCYVRSGAEPRCD